VIPDVVVVGGGCAGLSAGVRLAARGLRVLVFEARARLGGRATAFADSVTGEVVDNGQHVLLGCYSATFQFLREIGAADHVRLQSHLSVSMIDRAGRRSRLDCPSLPPPLSIVAGVFEWDALDWKDRLAFLRLRAPLKLAIRQAKADARRPDGTLPADRHDVSASRLRAASPGETVEDWLIRHGQTERIREMLWRPLALAALNQPTDKAGASAFARVLGEMFGSGAADAAVGLPLKPLNLMYAEPARAFIESRGGEVRTGAAARILVSGHAVDAVEAGGDRWRPHAVVAAVPWFGLAGLFDGIPPALASVIDRAGRMVGSPIATVNLWFDKPLVNEPFVGLPGREMQWVFDKRMIWGDGAEHLSLVSSGAESIVGLPNDRLIALAHEELLESLPGARSARLVRGSVVRERQGTFSLAPGQPIRPSTATGLRGLFLAGDWIDTGLPATIESAVRSGHWAAEAILSERKPGP
jgi:hydroxysqualene dehydroxylase